MSVSKKSVLSLYKLMLRECLKFPAYNFRMYSLRRIKDSFRTNRNLKEPKAIKEKFDEALRSFEIIKRQVVISSLYKTDSLVIERNHV